MTEWTPVTQEGGATPVPPAPGCKGTRLVTTARGIFGPMSLKCITCGMVISSYEAGNMTAQKWIAGAARLVKQHQRGTANEPTANEPMADGQTK